MKQYPETIDLSKYESISDAEIEQDIAETEWEIFQRRELMQAERRVAETTHDQMERRISDLKASARPQQIAEREAFVAFLKRIQAARTAAFQVALSSARAAPATQEPETA